MSTLGLAVAAVLGLLVLALAVPIDLAFSARHVGRWQARVEVRWLFGLVRFAAPAAARRPWAPRPARPAPPGRGGARRAVTLMRNAHSRQRTWRLLRDLAAAAHLRGLRLWLRLGLGDPADTGRLWALVGPLSAAAHGWRGASVQVQPEFIDAVFEFDASGRATVVPLQWIALALAYALSPTMIRAWVAAGAAARSA